MKKKLCKYVEEIVDITLEDMAKEIIDNYPIYEWADMIKDRDEILNTIEYEVDEEITDDEKENLLKLIISEITPKLEKQKKEELSFFNNRKNIIETLEDWLSYSGYRDDYYILSTEEILDEIIKNGNN